MEKEVDKYIESKELVLMAYPPEYIDDVERDIRIAFEAGAKWMAEQGYVKETQVYANRWTDVDEVTISLGQGEFGFKAGDNVILQIRKA